MPSISKIRVTNVVFEDGNKRFNDELFLFDGHNGAILLENGGGKTVFIHSVLQAVLPHTHLGDRKIKETLQLENAPAHIGIEWITSNNPRRYVTTTVSLFITNNRLDSLRYVYEYDEASPDALEQIPFVKETDGNKRPAERVEMMEYYSQMKSKSHNALTFSTITAFKEYIEEQYQIISNEWENIVKINRDEGGIEQFFENCRTTADLYDRLLIPTVEESIIGHDKAMFADLFEKQRSGFHMYKKLQESIQENERIQEELARYVGEFEAYSLKQTEYEKTKEQAKGFWNVIQEQRMAMENEAHINNEDNIVLDEVKQLHELKQASYQIHKELNKSNRLEKTYKQILFTHEELSNELAANNRQYQSFIYAKYRQEQKEHEELLKQNEEKLATYDKDDDLIDHEAEMEQENRKLHGYFQTKIENLLNTKRGLNYELRPLVDELNRLKDVYEKKTSKLAALKEQNVRMDAEITFKQEQGIKIKQQILANPTQEDVKTEQEKWMKRHQYLDEESIRLKQLEKENKHSIDLAEKEREELLEKKSTVQIQHQKQKIEEKQLQASHDELVSNLATIRSSWSSLDNLYMKENAVYQPLLELKAKLQKEQEELLYKERIANRFVDDYETQDIFFGDAFLSEQLKTWKNQFDYVVSGVEFYQALDDGEKESFHTNVLLPLLLITTSSTKDRLLKRIEQIADRLQFPVTVMTLEEITELGTETTSNSWVVPTHWETNLDHDGFIKWKQRVNEQATEATLERQQKGWELDQLKSVVKSFEVFFSTYPFTKREQLTTEISQLRNEIDSITRRVAEKRELANSLKKEQTSIHANIQDYASEMNGLTNNISKASEYLQLEKELATLEKIFNEDRKLISEQEHDLKQIDRQVDRYNQDIKELEARKQGLKSRVIFIEDDKDYQAVKHLKPLFTGEEKIVILQRRQELTFAIRKIQSSYSELITKRDHEKKHIDRIEKAMVEIHDTHEDLETKIEFPPDGEHLLEQLRSKIDLQKVEIEQSQKKKASAKEKMDVQHGEVNLLQKQFDTKYPRTKVYEFSIDFEEIAQKLTKEHAKIQEREAYVQQEKNRIAQELQDIQRAETELDRFEEGYYFKNSTVISAMFSEEEITSFTYKRMEYVENITTNLRSAKKNVDEGNEEITKAKRHFRDFCNRTITDSKLKNMAIQGVEHKETFHDILEFKKNMMISVERADKYARDYISENDKEIQAFINSIHNHLQNLTEQLRVIPRKTRVKIGDDWKEIFRFSIPEWTEEDGKSRIRNYIDWILEQLDSEHFMNEHGEEDSGKVRKQIETWLHSKQLLQHVMDNEVMKVHCRKVTNDNQVTTRSYSWERSNQWSGGEKWSKNMTLFLGILNFVAEKKQHINASMKRHRTVILDNPFGAASDEHVLNPVFFVAEQLGFQIIALTAHADGKFLQDYFPIIYSCRLRPSMDESKKVMTKEKSLHQAYFQDHEPAAMERLAEVEQIELF